MSDCRQVNSDQDETLLFLAAMLLLFVWFTVKSVFGLINIIQNRPAT